MSAHRIAGMLAVVVSCASVLGGCGGSESSASTVADPSTADDVPSRAADGSYVLIGDTTPCDSAQDMTIERLRPKLTPPGAHDYVMTYEDGQTTHAVLTLTYGDEVRCEPRGS